MLLFTNLAFSAVNFARNFLKVFLSLMTRGLHRHMYDSELLNVVYGLLMIISWYLKTCLALTVGVSLLFLTVSKLPCGMSDLPRVSPF